MITKIDNPNKAESKDYTNKGSSSRLKNYLIGNGEKIDQEDLFFDFYSENIQGDEMQKRIDNNVKGLKSDDHKFFSISINPSYDELAWIKDDKRKMKEYVRETMRNYAKSFKIDGVGEKDLVWGAIIHEKRFYTEKDEYVFVKKNPHIENPPFKAGDPKPGHQMHAHVIVSARDVQMQRTLNPLTASNKISRKFELKGFQRRNQESFQTMFYYKNGINIYAETQRKIVALKIEQLQRLGFQEQDFNKIHRVGEKMKYDSRFTRNLNRLVQETYRCNAIVNTEKYLELGDKKYKEEFPEGIKMGAFERVNGNVDEGKKNWNQLLLAVQDIERGAERQKIEKEEIKRKKRKKDRGI